MQDSTYSDGQPTNEAALSNLIRIKEVSAISRARSMRLQPGDVIFGYDSTPFRSGINDFQDLLEECDEDAGVLLTIWRDGLIYNVVCYGPLGATYEFIDSEIAEKIQMDINDYDFPKRQDLIVYEVLRDLYRRCEIIDTTPDPVATFVPPIWLVQHRLFEPLLAISLIYAITFAVHWVLFVISYIVLCVYFKRASLMMLRSFIVYRQYQMWLVIAARDLREVQEACRKVDPKTHFKDSLVGDPVEDEKPKKKKKRSTIPGT
ncbi:MAG TPA: hypothetical protein DIT62_03085 [Alphaproteobacteria bacterium]|nr:hypothetical protein [Alphaproteobacteria bacterium]